jgi:DNA mismatch endonuclease (patch repair protein)
MDRLTVDQRSRLMSRVRSRDTKPELIVRSTLHRLGYRYVLHCRNLAGTPDLVFPRRKKVIFVNGCFWHGHSCKFGRAQSKSNTEFWEAKIAGNAKRDKRNLAILRQQGWSVMVVWECRIKTGAWLIAAVKFLDKPVQQKL